MPRVIDCVLSLNRNYDSFVVPRLDSFERRHPESLKDFARGLPSTEFETSWLPMSRKPQNRKTLKLLAAALFNSSSTIV